MEGGGLQELVDDLFSENEESRKKQEIIDRQKLFHCCFDTLGNEARAFYLFKEVSLLREKPTPLEFYRNYVSKNLPVLIEHSLSHWPALKKWSADYLRNKIGETQVTVAVTPNGQADAIYEDMFVLPEERSLTFNKFLDTLLAKKENEIHYVQKQNSNMNSEFEDLMEDIDPEIEWASKAFDKNPDAVNFWMGDKRAVTSMHRDHYENIYCVIAGQKTFTLIPPTDLPFVPYENFEVGTHKQNSDLSWTVIKDKEKTFIPWVAVDPINPDLDKYPQFSKAHPIEVTVRAGQILYLPSLWFHRVEQSHGCIAVNYWYDMEFDIKYSYYKLLEKMTSITKALKTTEKTIEESAEEFTAESSEE